jgi:hypothetical protein
MTSAKNCPSPSPSPTSDLTVDQWNSLVTKKPRWWYVAFVPPLDKRWWHRFFHAKHKHCFAMTYVGSPEGTWLLFEPWWSRIMVTEITQAEADKFLAWAGRGDALWVYESLPGRSSQIKFWMTCAVLVAHLLGKNYWCWTPHQLYKRLRKDQWNTC